MKNFPHQFNDLEKLFKALEVARQLIDSNTPLSDENFGERLTRAGIHSPRNKTLSVDEYLRREQDKPAASRGYLTVSRETRRFLGLLGLIFVSQEEKKAELSNSAKQLLSSPPNDTRKELWRNAMLQMGLEGADGEISHPYRILLKLVDAIPGIESAKLMLALEAENDSEEEFDRISDLARLNVEEIVSETGITDTTAKNAVKILPSIALKLDDIQKKDNLAYPVRQIIVTEDEISTVEEPVVPPRERTDFKQVTSGEIARDPEISVVSSVSIDLSNAIRIRQKRLAEHQEIVRLLAARHEGCDFQLFEGRFDCLATKGDAALLYEVKTILGSAVDQEKQTVKGIGQLKYYKFSIVKRQMGFSNIREVLVFSKRPNIDLIDFCTAENVAVIWRNQDSFEVFNTETRTGDEFTPSNLLSDGSND